MKNFTAIYLPDPHNKMTKSGFKNIKNANKYINKIICFQRKFTESSLLRADWLVVETKTWHKHLDELEQDKYELQVN